MKKILAILVIVISTFAYFKFSKNEIIQKKELKVHNCINNSTISNLDSLPLSKSFEEYEDFISVNFENSSIKGNVENITEEVFEESIKFGEKNLTLTSKRYIEYKNMLRQGDFQENFKSLDSFTYNSKGYITQKMTKVDLSHGDVNDRKMNNIEWDYKINYYYENNNVIKEVKNTFYKNDSCVVKYAYENSLGKMPYHITKYDRYGDNSSDSYISYDSINNNLIIQTYGFFKNQNEIVITFNDKCKIIKITQVESPKNKMQEYSKAEFNEQGDILSWSKFKYPCKNEKEYNLTYLDEFQTELETNFKGESYTYVYDKIGNWIERKNGNKIINRKITYR